MAFKEELISGSDVGSTCPLICVPGRWLHEIESPHIFAVVENLEIIPALKVYHIGLPIIDPLIGYHPRVLVNRARRDESQLPKAASDRLAGLSPLALCCTSILARRSDLRLDPNLCSLYVLSMPAANASTRGQRIAILASPLTELTGFALTVDCRGPRCAGERTYALAALAACHTPSMTGGGGAAAHAVWTGLWRAPVGCVAGDRAGA
jgi:hypothetical protein